MSSEQWVMMWLLCISRCWRSLLSIDTKPGRVEAW